MTAQEAFAELGLDAGADIETVRRAYLRLIKERKPESDPEGFKRAREAFEVARAAGEMGALAALSAPGEPAAGVSGTTTADDATPQPTDPFQPYLAAWKAIPSSADMRKRLKVAEDARAALRGDRRAYWLVVSTLDGRALNVDLAEALRVGWRQGWPEFLEALLVRLPNYASPPEVDAALDSARVPLRLLAATVVARWDARRAASVVVETCERITSVASDGPAVEVPVERMLQVVFALHAVKAVSEANRAHAALRRCLQETGLELRVVSGPLGGVWILAEELAGLPPEFPPALRNAFAVAARAGDMRSAFFEACFHVRHHGREVRRWLKRLGTTAPNVVQTLRGAVQRESAKKYSWNLRQIPWTFLIWPALLMLVRAFVSGDSTPATDRRRIAASAPRAAVVGDDPLRMVRDADHDLCGDAGPRNGQFVCADIEAVLASLDRSECVEVPARVRAIKHKLYDRDATELDARLITTLELGVWQICPAPRGSGAGPDK